MAEKDGKFGKEIEINGSKVVVPDNVATAFQTLQEQNASLQSNYTTLNSQFTQLSSKLDNLKPPEKKDDRASSPQKDLTGPTRMPP